MQRTIEELLKEIRKLSLEYYNATGRRLGTTGEVCEYEAASKLSYTLQTHGHAGYDALDSAGKKIQIKGWWNLRGRPPSKVNYVDPASDFDYFVYVLLGKSMTAEGIWMISKQDLIALYPNKNPNRTMKKRVTLKRFQNAAEKVWPQS